MRSAVLNAPVFGRRHTGDLAEGAPKQRGRVEAAVLGDFVDAVGRGAQRAGGFFDAQLVAVLYRRQVELIAEQVVELRLGDAAVLRELVNAEIGFVVLVDIVERGEQR